MIRLQATKKEMREHYGRILSVGYCCLQRLLKYETSFVYSVRAYGWSCDYYDVDNVLISTGYSPLSNCNVKVSYDMIHDYEKLAEVLDSDYLPYHEAKIRMRVLVEQFVAECIKE